MSEELSIHIVKEIESIPADEWDALVSPNDPFTRHGFLQALEKSGSVGREAGWLPCHVVVYEKGKVVVAVAVGVISPGASFCGKNGENRDLVKVIKQ